MNPLVALENGEPRTTSLILAEGSDVQHKNVLELVRKYQKDLKEFGEVAFETRPRLKGQHGGGDVEVALLNEQQSTLIMMYMKNTPIVREFKKALVRAFFELRDMVRGKRVDVNFRHTRGITNPDGLDIKYTLDLTKIALRPTKAGLALLERLTGVCMDDILPETPETSDKSALFNDFYATHCRLVNTHERLLFSGVYAAFAKWAALSGSPTIAIPSKKSFSRLMQLAGHDILRHGGQAYIINLVLGAQ